VPVIVFAVFACVNVYLWVLPISQVRLLLAALTGGIVFFSWMLWFVGREPTPKP
jgi:hypothetical protein